MYYLILLGTVVSSSAFLESFFMDNNCSSSQFACRNGKCVDPKLRCDDINNCGDGTDEMDCELFLCKEPRFFRCKNHRCVSKSFVCDGENDCEDFSDEVDCENFKMSDHVESHCEKGHWQCADKLCIPDDWVCNGEDDCLDGSDELIGCTSKIECDGFKCKNGHCIPNEWQCDGNNDCHDNSDEEHCENHVPIEKCSMDNRKFLCSNNKTCIDLHLVCDGHPQCPDRSDEGPLCNTTFDCTKHGCSHECIHLPTGPKCLCPSGYNTIDDKHCHDINECEQFGICDQKCRNTPGSYECYCDHKYFLKEDRRTCKAMGGEALMIFSSKTEIRAFTLDSELYFPVAKNLKQVVGVDYDGHHVYWTDIFSEHESIVRSLEDGSEREILITAGMGLPEDLSVDWLTGNIYFTDAEKKHIGVCTSDGAHCTVLVNKDINKPRGIALNVESGEMYWTDWGSPAKICNSLMDGSNDKVFVSNDIHWPNGLALDKPNQRLYWTDAKKMTLESIHLDGTDRRIVLQDVVKHPYAISVFEDRLYWSDWATHSIQTCNKFTGKNHRTLVKDNKEFIYGISIFHSALHKRVENPCALSFCSDICLLKGDGYRCACPENKILGADQHICRDIVAKQMLIAGTKNTLVHIEHQFLGKHDVTSLPTVARDIGCLAFDTVNNTLLISDLASKNIISLNLDTGASDILDIAGLGRITAMDYDSRGNNLYICDEDRSTLEVINLNSMSRKILLHDMDGETPEAIALVPEEGVMFVSLNKKGDRSSHIDRFYMDGTGRTHGMESNLIGPISLYYDHDLHRVFFADAGTGLIESTSVEGDDRHQFRKLQTYPVSIATLNNDIFWVNANSKRLYWGEKKAESNFNKKITLDLTEDPEKLHLVSISARKQSVSSCRLNNNGCSHLCLLSHKVTVCACPAGWELSKDNRTCAKRVHCDGTEFLCHKSNTCILKSLRCNGHKDCASGEDEADCVEANKCSSGFFQCDDGECIREDLLCNHHYDCKDKSDEHNCSVKWNEAHCPPSHFRCANGNCIPDRFLCDGANDCTDNSDETNCDAVYCSDTQFRCDSGTCIPKSWECDHEYDCTDLSDEHSMCSSVTCPTTLHTCANGRCIDPHLLCDGADDCGDNSDERSCLTDPHPCGSGRFACPSNTSVCLPLSAKCNGTAECPRKEDEQGCSECGEEEFGCTNGKCLPVQWRCDGLDDCGDGSDERTEDCSRGNGTAGGVGPTYASCEDGFRCKTGDCIDLKLVCNGNHDCYDGSDEDGMCSVSCEGKKNPCSQVCLKTPAGPSCACSPGYKMMGNGFSCMDINECQSSPPVCSQLCHNQNGGYSCDCYNDFMLRSDKKSCKAEGLPMSLIFITGGQIRELTQKSNIMSIVFASPVPKITGLDVLLDPKSVYFSIEATSTIHRVDKDTQTRHYIKNVGQPQALAVDWSTRNVYYYNAEVNEKSIRVCNFEEKCAKLIDIDIHRQVSALAVDSVNKVMFYSVNSWWVFNAPSYVIYRCNLDGSGRTQLVQTTAGYVTDIAFDYNKKNLYFMDQHLGQINSMTYEGKSRTPIFSNITRSTGLKFFENHLYYTSNGGMIAKCRLYDSFGCESFRLHPYPVELFTIVQKTVQPPLDNLCERNTCSYMCVPGETSYRCLCPNGTLVARNEVCVVNEHSSENDATKYKVHSVSMKTDDSKKNSSGAIAAAILVPLFLLFIAGACLYNIKKKNNGGLSVSMRFYNPIYGKQVDDEHPILQPGQHEYSNPVHFGKEDAQLNVSDFSKKSLDV
ncbi:unnamed protein product [Phaedon cochleariae]|uniref:EGF-like domain-containing protein n=1 Tax=Phaedon cochleariae TaxID=80249 RepID=A0A9N9SB63_PHACE|nr:unnamed protein product [Phaedon cochleariae]